VLRRRRPSGPHLNQPRNRAAGYAGFCVHGFSGAAGDAARGDLEAHRRQVAEDARTVRELGGNLMRSFWMFESVLAGDPAELAVALNSVRRRELEHQAVFMRELPERVAQLDRCDATLDELLAAVQGNPSSRFRLDFAALDAVVNGLEDANRESSEQVRLLLTLVAFPPRWIVESPSDATLAAMGRSYTFASLWHRYIEFNAALHQRVVGRYATQRPLPTLCALEIVNEPDYHWTPQEVKIEGVDNDMVNPLGKYVTELQVSQVPVSNAPGQAFERTDWGFRDQDARWSALLPSTDHTRVLDFDWGRKFDW
jgi:hypothetical protein